MGLQYVDNVIDRSMKHTVDYRTDARLHASPAYPLDMHAERALLPLRMPTTAACTIT